MCCLIRSWHVAFVSIVFIRCIYTDVLYESLADLVSSEFNISIRVSGTTHVFYFLQVSRKLKRVLKPQHLVET